jgi:hypothetical protein
VPLPLQRKLSHLSVFARGLLPSAKQEPGLPPSLRDMLSDAYDGTAPTVTLRMLREANLEGAGNDWTWRENQAVPPHKFEVGDLGYIPAQTSEEQEVTPKGLGNCFVKLCNILQDDPSYFNVVFESNATQWDWDAKQHRREVVQGYEAGLGKVMGWPVAVLPGRRMDVQVEHVMKLRRAGDAWKWLLEHGNEIGRKYKVRPEELILSGSHNTTAACDPTNNYVQLPAPAQAKTLPSQTGFTRR